LAYHLQIDADQGPDPAYNFDAGADSARRGMNSNNILKRFDKND
jgi:hypothetical protein